MFALPLRSDRGDGISCGREQDIGTARIHLEGRARMIEVVSYPPDLSIWEPDVDPFYLELYGETNPELDTSYAETSASPAPDGTGKPASRTPIYEYWWTLGRPGGPHHPHHRWPVAPRALDLWQHLREPAGRVYLYFPQTGGWRVHELVASIKYLVPIHEQEKLTEHAAQTFGKLAPFVDDMSKIAAMAPNPAFTATSAMLATIAKLRINDVPRAAGFDWSVAKVTCRYESHGVMQGLVWTLPKEMFSVLGGRLTGSVAVSFVPASFQAKGQVASAYAPPEQRPLLAHAVIYGHGDTELWAPRKGAEFVELQVKPVLNPT